MNELSLFSPAKINLFLHLTGRRDDGYHNLQSVFRALDFGDTLTFRRSSSSRLVTLIGADGLTDTPDDNLIVKAVHALAQRFPAYQSSVQVILDKQIPTGAGLGGGSGNCAMTLIAINELWGLRLGVKELIAIAATLGADVPFFVFAHLNQSDAIVGGIGEELSAIELPKREYLLLLPDEHSSTAECFANLAPNTKMAKIADIASQQDGFLDRLSAPFCNVFESVVVPSSPKVANALAYLQTLAPITKTDARMTGTGSAVFLPIVYGLTQADRHAFVQQAPCRARLVGSLY